MGVDDEGQWPRTQPPREDWPFGEAATERMGGPGSAGAPGPSPTGAGGARSVFPDESPGPPGSGNAPADGVAPTQSMAGLDPPSVSDAVPPGGRPAPTVRMPGTPPHGQAPPAAPVAATQAFAPAPGPQPAYPPQAPRPGPYQQQPPSPYQAPPGRGPAQPGPPRPAGPPPQRPPAAGQGRPGGGSSPLHMPFIGAVIALIGLGMLWMATHSENWVETAAVSYDLSQLQEWAGLSNGFQFVSWYADMGWVLLFAFVAYVMVIATLLNFKSRGVRTLLWLPVSGPFAFFNLTDGSGRAAPRVLGALAMLAPAALLAAVWVDLRVEPEFNSGSEVPEDFDPNNPEDVAALDLDPEQAAELGEVAAGGTPDLGTLQDLGLELEGFSNDDIGTGMWMSFGGVGVVAVGAVVGTRKTS